MYRETKSVCVYRDLEIEGVCRERERRKCSGVAGVFATPRDFCLIPQNFFDDLFLDPLYFSLIYGSFVTPS